LLGDPYWTDGRRAVIVFSEEPVAMNDISFFIWDFIMKVPQELMQRLEQESGAKAKWNLY